MRRVIALITTVICLAALVQVAGATAASKPSTVPDAMAELRSTGGDEPEASSGDYRLQAATCSGDPTGDTIRSDTLVVESYPKADITSWCGEPLSGTFRLSFQVVEPTDPATDPNWQGITGGIWDIDVDGDAEVEYVAFLLRDGWSVDTEGGTTVCSGTGGFDGSTYAVPVPLSCIGSPSSVRVAPGFLYDSDFQDPEAPVYGDFAPNSGGWSTSFATGTSGGGGGRPAGRLAGSSRYATAVAISKHQFPNGATTVFLANAVTMVDALAGGSLTGGPILLVPGCGPVPAEVRSEIARLNPDQVLALGGGAAICDATLAEAAAS